MNAQTQITHAGKSIRVAGLGKTYGDFHALSDIDLDIAAGEFLPLLGPSGSGKSTLLMSIAGFVQPTSGNIFVSGHSIVDMLPERRNFGVVFQGYALFPHMTVRENLAYPLKVRGETRAAIRARVAETLELVQLGHLADRMPRQLSGGQQQRVALARALVFSPEVLLLDEPMGALDKKLRHDLQLELRELHRRLGRTFVNVTHDQEEAMTMSDRIAIMNAGRIIQLGAPRDLYDAPRTRFVADFLGKSNFLTGHVQGVDGGIARIDTPEGPVLHAISDPRTGPAIGQEVLLALRPQKLGLNGGANRLKVRVMTATFLGTCAELVLRCATGMDMTAQIDIGDTEALPEEGSEIEIGWEPTQTRIVAPD